MLKLKKNERAVREYIKQVSKAMPCGEREKRKVIEAIEMTIEEEYCESTGISYDGLVRRIGSPTEIAESYLSQVNAADMARRVRYRSSILKIVVAAAAVALLIWGGYCAVSYFSFKDEMPIYIVEGEVEIVDRVEDGASTPISSVK